MVKNAKTILRKRKPLIRIICEGRNQTERIYFGHFNNRDSPYGLAIINSEATDVENMAKKAKGIFDRDELDKRLGDRVFCLIDLDLDSNKYQKLLLVKKKYKNIDFIVSNPCFEVWFIFHFTDNPKVESSSQNVKKQMLKYVEDYAENTDVYSVKDLKDKYAIAINNSEKKSNNYSDIKIIDRNPYTEVQNVLIVLCQSKR